MSAPDLLRAERESAWIGDAVLSLFARSYILRNSGVMDQSRFAAMTSNSFLSAIGNPTRVESRIGEVYHAAGLDAAFEWIEKELLPLFLKQEKKRARQGG